MNPWRASHRGWRSVCVVLGLLLGGVLAAGSALASPTSRLEDDAVGVFVSTMLSNGRGTGFGVGDGSWVVTCYHVVTVHVAEDQELPVEHVMVLSPWTGEPTRARVVATDPKADLALLKLDKGRVPVLPIAGADAFPAAKLAGEKELFTIVGYGQTAAQIETDPDIHTSTTHAELLAVAAKAERQVLLFAPTSGAGPGWSGGPVVSERGQVVGVFRALVAQPQVRDVWYPLATGVEPLRALLTAHGVALAPDTPPPARSSDAGALFQREFRALVWGLARRWDRAEKERRAELLLRPNDPVPHMGLSLALMWQGQMEEALKEAETAVTLAPKRAGALFQKGLTLQRMSRPQDAESCMRRALELEPDDAERRITLGALLAAEGKGTEATAMLRRAAELAPNHPLAHWRLGMALEAESKWDEAVTAMRRAADLSKLLPPLRVVRIDLAEALQKDGKTDEAEAEWRDLAHSDDDPSIQYRLAEFLAGRKKSPEALEAIQKCLSLLAQHADADLLQRANELKTKLEAKSG